MTDARFEDAPYAEKPLRLRAESAEDLAVISSLLQDAVGKAGDIHWLPKKRRLVVLLNRFRWENHVGKGSDATARPCERVRTALSIESALKVRARGLDPRQGEQVFELLALMFQPTEGCAGTLTLTMAGSSEVAAEVECLELSMTDLTRPWTAKAQRMPAHEG